MMIQSNFCYVFCFLSFIEMGEVRVATLNLNGAREQRKRAEFF